MTSTPPVSDEAFLSFPSDNESDLARSLQPAAPKQRAVTAATRGAFAAATQQQALLARQQVLDTAIAAKPSRPRSVRIPPRFQREQQHRSFGATRRPHSPSPSQPRTTSRPKQTQQQAAAPQGSPGDIHLAVRSAQGISHDQLIKLQEDHSEKFDHYDAFLPDGMYRFTMIEKVGSSETQLRFSHDAWKAIVDTQFQSLKIPSMPGAEKLTISTDGNQALVEDKNGNVQRLAIQQERIQGFFLSIKDIPFDIKPVSLDPSRPATDAELGTDKSFDQLPVPVGNRNGANDCFLNALWIAEILPDRKRKEQIAKTTTGPLAPIRDFLIRYTDLQRRGIPMRGIGAALRAPLVALDPANNPAKFGGIVQGDPSDALQAMIQHFQTDQTFVTQSCVHKKTINHWDNPGHPHLDEPRPVSLDYGKIDIGFDPANRILQGLLEANLESTGNGAPRPDDGYLNKGYSVQYDQPPEQLSITVTRDPRHLNEQMALPPENLTLNRERFNPPSVGPQQYSIRSFIIHHGAAAQTGHYVACVKHGDKYYLYDNENRHPITKDQFLELGRMACHYRYELVPSASPASSSAATTIPDASSASSTIPAAISSTSYASTSLSSTPATISSMSAASPSSLVAATSSSAASSSSSSSSAAIFSTSGASISSSAAATSSSDASSSSSSTPAAISSTSAASTSSLAAPIAPPPLNSSQILLNGLLNPLNTTPGSSTAVAAPVILATPSDRPVSTSAASSTSSVHLLDNWDADQT